MDKAAYETYGEDLVKVLRELLAERYGRDAAPGPHGYGLSLLGASYRLTGGWWSLRNALGAGGTSFQTEQLRVRLDVLLADVLLHPADPTCDGWAAQYGYSSAGAVARAFRTHYDLSLGHVRRVAVVGQWLALAQRLPRNDKGRARRDEAESRVTELQGQLRTRRLGPTSAKALREFASARSSDIPALAQRPRYPTVGRSERVADPGGTR